MNAYRYEKSGVPMKGAYVMMPKLRPRLDSPHTDDTIPGSAVKTAPYAMPVPILYELFTKQVRTSSFERGAKQKRNQP